MFIPLHDANRLRHVRRQYVTLAVIGLNLLFFSVTGLAGQPFLQANAYGFGFTPAAVSGQVALQPHVPVFATYVTYSFLHGDIIHLLGNMVFLWVFGDNVEDALGHVRFLLFYLAAAAAGAFMHFLALPESDTPLIGASGAVAGVVTAYLILHPKVRLWVLVFGRLPLRLPAFVPILLWIAYQFYMFSALPDDRVSWPTHVGGILAGALLVLVLRRRGVPLFDRAVVTPQSVEVGDASGKDDGVGMRWGRQ